MKPQRSAKITSTVILEPVPGFSACCANCLRKLGETESAWFVSVKVPRLKLLSVSMRYCDECAVDLVGEEK